MKNSKFIIVGLLGNILRLRANSTTKYITVRKDLMYIP